MAIDASKLQIALEEGDRWRRTMSITVPAEVVRAERQKAAEKLSKRLKLPGFRKGKIPAGVVEQRYGQALRRETLDRLIGEAYKQALRLESIRPISEGEVEDVDYDPEADLRFSISFDVSPEITLGRLGGFSVRRPSAQVSDEDVDRVLQRLLQQNGTWRVEEEGQAESGDLVSVQIQRLDSEEEGGQAPEPKSYEFVLGEGDAIPDVEEAILTLTPGESGEFAVTFPEDFPNEELRGQQQRLRIDLVERKGLELPELDDAFAAEVGGFEDLAELRSKVREDLTREAEEQAESEVRSQLVDQLLDANAFQVPRTMVERYLQQILGDGEDVPEEKMAEAREQLRPQAERAVKRILLVDRVADTQGLGATEDELDDRVEAIAERNDTTPAQVYARLQKAGRLESLEREITERKVFDFLKEQSEIVDAT